MWPQSLEAKWRDADKNQLEQSVCRQLCRGDITLEQAQAWFLEPDWTKSYESYCELKNPLRYRSALPQVRFADARGEVLVDASMTTMLMAFASVEKNLLGLPV